MAAPSGAPPAPLPVVGPQFCAPYVVPLTVTKKAISLSDGDFTVTDGNGAVVLRVKGALFSIRHRRVLLDAAGQPLLSMQEKVSIILPCAALISLIRRLTRNSEGSMAVERNKNPRTRTNQS